MRELSVEGLNDAALTSNGELILAATGSGLWAITTQATDAPPQAVDNTQGGDTRVALSADGMLAAAALKTGGLVLWDRAGGSLTPALAADSPQILSIAINPARPLLAAGSDLGSLYVLDSGTGELIQRLAIGRSIIAVAFSPEGALMASAGTNQKLILWDVDGLRALNSFEEEQAQALAFSPDGLFMASGDDAGTITLRIVFSGKVAATISTGSAPITALAFNPSGSIISAGDADGVFYLWDAVTGQDLISKQMGSAVLALGWSADGTTIMTASADGEIRLWQATR